MPSGKVVAGAGSVALAVLAIAVSRKELVLPEPATGPVQPTAEEFHSHVAPLKGVYKPNERLLAAQKLFQGQMQGSETVSVASDGSLALSPRNGSLYWARPQPDGSFALEHKPFAQLQGGRPLGTKFDANGDLIVCNAGVGLQKVDVASGTVTTLSSQTSQVGNDSATPVRYANDLDIAADGTIYFSESTHIRPAYSAELGAPDVMNACILAFCQGELSGRVLAYHPSNGSTTVVTTGLLFANGVALSADGSFLLLVDTGSTRVWKVWLHGPKAGTKEIFLDQLPGFPDSISRSADGKSFWLPIISPPGQLAGGMHYRFTRFLIAWTSKALAGLAPQWGCLLQISPEGQVLQMLMDPKGSHITSVPSILDLGDKLVLGNLDGDYTAVVSL